MPLTAEELTKVCAEAEDAAHCGRLVEEVQLPRLPNLAVRDKLDLKVSLYPSGSGRRSRTPRRSTAAARYSLWDFMSEINTVVLYVTDGDDASFLLLQRTTGRKSRIARRSASSRPTAAPRHRGLLRAPMHERGRGVARHARRRAQGAVRGEPAATWTDAVATWKDAQTIVRSTTRSGARARMRASRADSPEDRTGVRAPAQ